MRAVNLLPKKEGRERRRPKPNVVASAGFLGAIALTAVVALLFLSASGGVTERQNELDNLQAELAATPPPPPPDTSGETLVQEKSGRVAAVSTALAGRVAWDRVLREISLVLPDDVSLRTLAGSAPAGAAAVAAAPGTPTGGTFAISGRTYSHDAVARLLARLELIPHLASVKLEKSTMSKVDGRDVVEFTIGASVRGPEASS